MQSLLRLDDIEKLRSVLQKIANAYTKELPSLERAETDARNNFLAALGADQLSKQAFLLAVNPHREVLGLAPLTDLGVDTSVKEGLIAAAADAPGRVPKFQAAADFAALTDALRLLRSDAFRTACVNADERAAEFGKDAAGLDGLSRETLLKSALEAYDG